MPGGQELLGYLAVSFGTCELINHLAVPIEAEPGEAFEDRVDCRLRRAFAIGILDPQQHLARAATGIKPIEQRRTRSADVKKARGGGGKTGDYAHFDISPAGRWSV